MSTMIEAVQKHLISEIDRSARSDTVFVISGVAFNLLVLFVNWINASNVSKGQAGLLIFSLFMVGSIVVSCACLLALRNSRTVCIRCHDALQAIYIDTDVAKYMPKGMENLGERRYLLSFVVVSGAAVLAVFVPLISMSAK